MLAFAYDNHDKGVDLIFLDPAQTGVRLSPSRNWSRSIFPDTSFFESHRRSYFLPF